MKLDGKIKTTRWVLLRCPGTNEQLMKISRKGLGGACTAVDLDVDEKQVQLQQAGKTDATERQSNAMV